jgi:hypothetical protein
MKKIANLINELDFKTLHCMSVFLDELACVFYLDKNYQND